MAHRETMNDAYRGLERECVKAARLVAAKIVAARDDEDGLTAKEIGQLSASVKNLNEVALRIWEADIAANGLPGVLVQAPRPGDDARLIEPATPLLESAIKAFAQARGA